MAFNRSEDARGQNADIVGVLSFFSHLYNISALWFEVEAIKALLKRG